MKLFFLVALGSGIGGIMRYAMQLFFYKTYPSVFPLGTFSVNVIGCFLIGIFVGLAEKDNMLSPETKIFLVTGICGGFTTFSSFSNENITLIKSGEWFYFFLYMAGSVVLGLLATYLGMLLIKTT